MLFRRISDAQFRDNFDFDTSHPPGRPPGDAPQPSWQTPFDPPSSAAFRLDQPNDIDVLPASSIDTFVQTFNPAESFRMMVALQSLHAPAWQQNQRSLLNNAFIAALNLQGRDPGGSTSHLSAYFSHDQKELPIVIDTGASVSLTPCASDFISSIEPPRISNLHGPQGSVNIVGEGTVQWTIRDAVEVVKTIQT